MKALKTLSVCISVALAHIGAHAAGIEYSPQSVDVLFQDGNYLEAGYFYVDPDIQGTDLLGNKVEDVAEPYDFKTLAIKLSPTKTTSMALLYDEPFGVSTKYPSGNLFNNALGATLASVSSQNLTLLGGGQLTDRVKIYGGVAVQEAGGSVNGATPLGPEAATREVLASQGISAAQFQGLQQRAQSGDTNSIAAVQGLTQAIGQAATTPTLYKMELDDSTTYGYVLGGAYEIPDIALRLAITYRSETEHTTMATESVQAGALGNFAVSPTRSRVSFNLPQSVNLDFQTGIMPKTLLMTSFRWVNWKAFDVKPQTYAQLNNNKSLAGYDNDQFSGSVGIGRQLTNKVAGQISYSYDSGTGKPYTLLGPYDDQHAIGLGFVVNPVDNIDVSVGAQYLMLGDAPNVEGNNNFKDNSAIAAGMKLGYKF